MTNEVEQFIGDALSAAETMLLDARRIAKVAKERREATEAKLAAVRRRVRGIADISIVGVGPAQGWYVYDEKLLWVEGKGVPVYLFEVHKHGTDERAFMVPSSLEGIPAAAVRVSWLEKGKAAQNKRTLSVLAGTQLVDELIAAEHEVIAARGLDSDAQADISRLEFFIEVGEELA